jgi:5,5'-dehydrodivanillate O-demethylase
MPLEPAGSAFKSKVAIKAYPVQEMGGLIWAYLGPAPAPVLPRWDIYARPGAYRQMIGHKIPANWLQVVENQADPGHIPYGHGRFFQYVLEREGRLSNDPRAFYNAGFNQTRELQAQGLHLQFRAIPNEFGYTVGRKVSDQDDDTPGWNAGAGAMLFPTMLSSGPGDIGTRVRRWCQVVVPIDDTTTWQYQYFAYFLPDGVNVPEQDHVPYTEIPLRAADGSEILDYALGQDIAIFQAQGAIVDRSKERLGVSDAIVIAYRKLLAEQIDRALAGGDPINVFRDASLAERPDLRLPGNRLDMEGRPRTGLVMEPFHQVADGGRMMIDDVVDRYNRDRDTIVALFAEADAAMKAAAPSPAARF